MTRDYILLQEKAEHLAIAFGYDLINETGHFSFYNSPDFRPFNFQVDPETFRAVSVEWFLYRKFNNRLYE